MSDQGFREIQLSGKQLVFLFVSSVVVGVTVFLLGVSVGRGVKQASGAGLESVSDTTQATQAAAPVEMPPPTEITPADTRYSQLDGSGGRGDGAAAASAPAQAASADGATPVDEPLPAPSAATPEPPKAGGAPEPTPKTTATTPRPAPATATREPAVKDSRTQAAPADSDLPRSAPNGQWVVQVGSYRQRESADREVAGLRKKGYTAFVLSGGTNFYRVRVGPFRERADAQRTSARLGKEGFTPFVTR
jgi:DedD protein